LTSFSEFHLISEFSLFGGHSTNMSFFLAKFHPSVPFATNWHTISQA